MKFFAKYSLGVNPECIADVDTALNREIHERFAAGDSRNTLNNLYYAVRYQLNIDERRLPLPAAARVGYMRHTKSHGREPVTWEETLLVAHEILTGARRPALQAVAAASALLQFDLGCRPGDLPKVRVGDVSVPQPGVAAMDKFLITLFPSTREATDKVNAQDDTVAVSQFAHRAGLAQVVRALIHRRKASDQLLPLTQAAFKEELKDACLRLGLPASTPHQLRHGAASMDAMMGVDTEEIRRRHRWSSAKSIARYRQPGRYVRALARLTPARVKLANILKTSLPSLLAKDLRFLLKP